MQEFKSIYNEFHMPINNKIKFTIKSLQFCQLAFLLACILLLFSNGFTSLAIACFAASMSIGLYIEAYRRKLLELRIEKMINLNQIKEV